MAPRGSHATHASSRFSRLMTSLSNLISMRVRPSSYSCADTTHLNIAALRMPPTTPATKAAQLHGAAEMYLRAKSAGPSALPRGRASGLQGREYYY